VTELTEATDTTDATAAVTAATDRRGELLALPLLMLSAASTLVDAIQAGVEARGFVGVRPAHGFAFVRIAGDGATIAEIGEHLGVTKQAASQLVDELLRRGYVVSSRHPRDARAKLVTLTEQGRAVTRAADDAAIEAAQEWVAVLGEERVRELIADLSRVVRAGKLRPLW
jgi:DNA-binding MarR family transcriptional regulator